MKTEKMHDAPMRDAVEYEPAVFQLKAAAQILNLSPWTLRRWCYDGKVNYTKMGKLVMVSREELDRVLQQGVSAPPRTPTTAKGKKP